MDTKDTNFLQMKRIIKSKTIFYFNVIKLICVKKLFVSFANISIIRMN